MEFRILGSLRVCDGDREITVSGHKQRGLLALLLLHANQSVSEDGLIEALWGEGASEKAGRNLHVLVSRLRASIGADRVLREAGGYLIRVEEGELDVDQFERLRREHRPAEALELWRGPALADFAFEGWAQNETRRLEELRLVSLEERIESDLASGDHAEVVGELQKLVAENPLRETLRRYLIVALYRCGRQAEALEAYQDARRMLDEELGLEPSPALRELEGAVLRQDPDLDAPSRVRALAPQEKRRSGMLLAAAAAMLGFAGAATAVVLLQRHDVDRVSAAALPNRVTTTSSTQARTTPTTTGRLVVVRNRRTTPKPKASPPRTQTSATAQPVPPPALPPAPRPPEKTAPARTRPRSVPPPPPRSPAQPAIAPERFTDNFDDGVRNGTLWHQIITGTGITLAERNGRLEIEFAADGVAGGDFNVLGAHYGTQCRFLGDFDARVDFELLEWPPLNGVQVALNAWFARRGGVMIARQSQTWDEEYMSWADPRSNSRPTLDLRGSLRVKRVGNTISTHYKSGKEWLSLGAARTDESPMLAIQAMTINEQFGDKPVRVAFDNFELVAHQPVC
ncbi:MAG TPA: AfsR/SARP family transcriptional regulator [Actinomycetota bacterium]|nr:AfsR/SARP family transcriptional regulator [Actinomycetota bacterium]